MKFMRAGRTRARKSGTTVYHFRIRVDFYFLPAAAECLSPFAVNSLRRDAKVVDFFFLFHYSICAFFPAAS